MADFRLGRLKFNWRGDWQSSTAYVIDDIAKFGANTYVCTTNHTSVSDETTWYASDLTTKWSLHTEGQADRGTWASGVFYKVNDVVTYGNTIYRVTQSFTSATPFDTTYLTEYLRGFEYEDSWNNSTEYQQGDIVNYGGYSYLATSINTNKPPSQYLALDWDVITTGFDVVGTYATTTDYKPGDVVRRGGYSYVAITTSTNVEPTNTASWDLIVKGLDWRGAFATATTYQLGDAVSRNSNSYVSVASTNQGNDPATDTSGEYWNPLASGVETNVMTTAGDIIIRGGSGSARLGVGGTAQVLTVSNSGYPEWQTNNVTAPVYYVTEEGDNGNTGANISNAFATLGKALTVATGNATIYVKAGVYNEILPLVVPPEVTVCGDNIRTTEIQAASGNGNHWDITLDTAIADVAYGAVITFSDGSVGTYIDSDIHDTVIELILSSGTPTSGITISQVNGATYTTATVTVSSLSQRTNAQSKMFLMSDKTMLKDLQLRGLEGYVPAGVAHSATGSISGTTLTATGLIDDLVGTSITGTGLSAGTTIVSVTNATTAEVSVSQTVASTALTFTAPAQDVNNATVKGIFISLNPATPITKSPYISQCSSFSVKGMGAKVDGRIHRAFPPSSATPSNKSIVFDSFTNIHDEGVSFWVTNNGAAEFVSCFSYYAHISYAATRGGKIRSLAGNSSWGTYGLVSSGYNFDETPITGTIEGLQVKYNTASLTGNGFEDGQTFVGSSSGAMGYVNTAQTGKLVYSLMSAGPLGVGTGFASAETITSSNGTTATLLGNTDANTGINGFSFPMTNLPSVLEEGGSVEFVTGSGPGGLNNQTVTGADGFTYVISSVSNNAPDDRGTMQVTRGALASVAAGHTGGTSDIIAYPESGNTTTLIANTIPSDTTIYIGDSTGFVQNGFASIGDELMKITNVLSSTSLEVTRSSQGSGSAASHAATAPVVAIGTSVPVNSQFFKDVSSSDTGIMVKPMTGFSSTMYIKVGTEFIDVNVATADTIGLRIVVVAEEKAATSYDGQSVKVRYLYSQGRFTGHDFLQVGTGGTATTNWPGLPTQDPDQTNEVIEDFPGRVFYVSSDSQGNFRVGKYFKVNQATGSATLNASAFDLSGLTSLRLGSIGAQLGAQINEFSTDSTLSQNSNKKVPTQAAVKAYIDAKDTATKLSVAKDGFFYGNS